MVGMIRTRPSAPTVDEAAADALLEQLRVEAEMNPDEGPFGGTAVSLENFLPMPDAIIEQIRRSTGGACRCQRRRGYTISISCSGTSVRRVGSSCCT